MAEAAERPTPVDPLVRIWGELRDLGLESYVADLDAHGYTVIPPEIASPNGLARRFWRRSSGLRRDRPGLSPRLRA